MRPEGRTVLCYGWLGIVKLLRHAAVHRQESWQSHRYTCLREVLRASQIAYASAQHQTSNIVDQLF